MYDRAAHMCFVCLPVFLVSYFSACESSTLLIDSRIISFFDEAVVIFRSLPSETSVTDADLFPVRKVKFCLFVLVRTFV